MLPHSTDIPHATLAPIMERKVFIQANSKQMVGAILSKFSIEQHLPSGSDIHVEILDSDTIPLFRNFLGKKYTQDGEQREHDPEDQQSFTFTRFMPPGRMGYAGRAIVIDPDVFALADVTELMELDLQGHAIAAIKRGESWKSSVMLLDNAKLRHWDIEKIVAGLQDGSVDSGPLKALAGEDVLELSKDWNTFDAITPSTKMIHMTRKLTQPWKTGLPIDFVVRKRMPKLFGIISREWVHRLLGRNPVPKVRLPHPDLAVERFFFSLANDALRAGAISKEFIDTEIAGQRIRPDFYARMEELTTR